MSVHMFVLSHLGLISMQVAGGVATMSLVGAAIGQVIWLLVVGTTLWVQRRKERSGAPVEEPKYRPDAFGPMSRM